MSFGFLQYFLNSRFLYKYRHPIGYLLGSTIGLFLSIVFLNLILTLPIILSILLFPMVFVLGPDILDADLSHLKNAGISSLLTYPFHTFMIVKFIDTEWGLDRNLLSPINWFMGLLYSSVFVVLGAITWLIITIVLLYADKFLLNSQIQTALGKFEYLGFYWGFSLTFGFLFWIIFIDELNREKSKQDINL